MARDFYEWEYQSLTILESKNLEHDANELLEKYGLVNVLSWAAAKSLALYSTAPKAPKEGT